MGMTYVILCKTRISGIGTAVRNSGQHVTEENTNMSTPAGWYPQNDGQQRYWDGQQWTEHFAPGASDAPATPDVPGAAGAPAAAVAAPKAKRAWYVKKRVLIPAGVLVLAIIGGAMGGGDDPTTPVSAS